MSLVGGYSSDEDGNDNMQVAKECTTAGSGTLANVSVTCSIVPAKSVQSKRGGMSVETSESGDDEMAESDDEVLECSKLAKNKGQNGQPAAKSAAWGSLAATRAFVPPQVRAKGRVVSAVTDNISDRAFEHSQ
mmetsp:Transcript_109114/g.211338  ORF Transcript_109114/g.211338 Transcript_109114/m.211338 type:complete len:133 (+) Transcript_109114:90-488(+)